MIGYFFERYTVHMYVCIWIYDVCILLVLLKHCYKTSQIYYKLNQCVLHTAVIRLPWLLLPWLPILGVWFLFYLILGQQRSNDLTNNRYLNDYCVYVCYYLFYLIFLAFYPVLNNNVRILENLLIDGHVQGRRSHILDNILLICEFIICFGESLKSDCSVIMSHDRNV